MADTMSLKQILSNSLNQTARVIVPSLPYAALFVLTLGGLVWAAGALPDGSAGSAGFSVVALVTLFTHSLFSARMYHVDLVPEAGLIRSAWILTLAWLLVIVVAAIGASIILLFFSLIGSSLGVAANESGQDITDMTAQMRANGTFWPLFGVFLATIFGVFWFAVRMMLFAAASATRGRVHVFRTWSWTKGHFRTLGPAMGLMVALPVLVLSSVASAAAAFVAGPVAGTVLVMIILLPSAWLGHGFAASAYQSLAPKTDPRTGGLHDAADAF